MEDDTAVMEAPVETEIETEAETGAEESPYFTQEDYQAAVGEEGVGDEEKGETDVEDGAEGDDETQGAEDEESPAGQDEEAGDESPSTINAGLAAIAHRVGMTEDEVQAFGNDDALIQGIQLLQNHSNGSASEEDAQEQAAEDGGLKFEPFAVPDTVKEILDEPMNEFFESMNTHYQGQINTALESLNAMNAQLQDMALQQWDERLSDQFQNLGDEFKDIFGEGHTWDLAKGSDHLNARIEVMDRMEKLSADSNLSFEQLLKQSIDSLHTKTLVNAERKSVSDQLRKNGKRLTERPTQKNTQDSRQPRERALANLKAKMRQLDDDYDE
tara:strand:- start:11457 stop:12440 length:984 start_codon:yes stop_codon:yes gene_type:complete